MRITPPKLTKGDTIALVATARKVSEQEMRNAISVFESWGLNVYLAPLLYHQNNQFAGDDHERAIMFNECLRDENIKAIVCARGGYGTVRIIDALNLEQLIKNPKWIIGYSDITVLHSHLHQNTNLVSLHATMPINMQVHNINVQSVDLLKQVLMGVEPIKLVTPSNNLNRLGNANGTLIGGNLSVLYSLLGSNSDIDTDGKILFLEDLDEYLYHIDRMMQALSRSGKLSKLAGLVVGGMNDMKDNTVPFGATAEEIIKSIVHPFNYPVCFDFPSGHREPNFPLLMGAQVNLEINTHDVKLVFH